ncbi:MAG TPA: nucleotidyltransferase domain-containing protein [Nannocystaceae bacterium]|nr:nucleotidyltransferase domain-containing protein [Nannocystaceae bacterium]
MTALPREWAERIPRIRARLVERIEARMRADEARADRLRASARSIAAALALDHDVERVWLFGSLAGGTVHEHSDLDLLVEGLAIDRLASALGAAQAIAPEVDLVRLEDAPPALVALARDYGEVLFDRG